MLSLAAVPPASRTGFGIAFPAQGPGAQMTRSAVIGLELKIMNLFGRLLAEPYNNQYSRHYARHNYGKMPVDIAICDVDFTAMNAKPCGLR